MIPRICVCKVELLLLIHTTRQATFQMY